MPHTLTAEEDLSGAGTWSWPGGGDVADLLYITVTTRGSAVIEMDSVAPQRLLHVGWLAIGAIMPSDGGALYFQEPFWIVFDNMIWNAYAHDLGHAGDIGVVAIRYQLSPDTTVNIKAFTFT